MKQQPPAYLSILYLFLLLFSLVIGKAVAQHKKSPPKKEDIPTVNLCDVSSSPHKYEGKVIRIQATFTTSFEGLTLKKADCPDGQEVIKALLDCDEEVCNEWRNKLHKDAVGNPFDGECVDVVVVGRVISQYPEGVESRPNDTRGLFYIQSIENTASSRPTANEMSR